MTKYLSTKGGLRLAELFKGTGGLAGGGETGVTAWGRELVII